ncbi:MAG: GAF domain-containing protein [Chloroflexota bacterium]
MQSVEPTHVPTSSKAELYSLMSAQVSSVFESERDLIANMANCAALIYHTLPDLNWAGFYLLRGKDLIVGPFQGKPACVRIPLGKGVCGTAATRQATIVVEDVDQFAGHIACDSASRSEIVIPLLKDGHLIGVLDIDSPILSRFNAEDAVGLEAIAALFIQLTDIPVIQS